MVDDHADKVKCLYGPGTYEPWECELVDCKRNTREFYMTNHIFKAEDGRSYHGICAREACVFDAEEIYGNPVNQLP